MAIGDGFIFWPSIILALPSIGWYALNCQKNGAEFDVQMMMSIFLNSSTMVAAGLVILAAVVPEIGITLSNIRLYVVVGGAAIIVMNFRSLRANIVSPVESPEETKDEVASSTDYERDV